jgi:hypothetical protein
MQEVQIFVSRNKDIRAAIIVMLEQKSGVKYSPSQDCSHGRWLKNDGAILWVGDKVSHRDEITIAQLESMPDHQPTKEMTISEISKELGYDVKIVK